MRPLGHLSRSTRPSPPAPPPAPAHSRKGGRSGGTPTPAWADAFAQVLGELSAPRPACQPGLPLWVRVGFLDGLGLAARTAVTVMAGRVSQAHGEGATLLCGAKGSLCPRPWAVPWERPCARPRGAAVAAQPPLQICCPHASPLGPSGPRPSRRQLGALPLGQAQQGLEEAPGAGQKGTFGAHLVQPPTAQTWRHNQQTLHPHPATAPL